MRGQRWRAMGSVVAAVAVVWLAGCSATGAGSPTRNDTLAADARAQAARAWMRYTPDQLAAGANAYLAKMTLDQKIGQLLMLQYTSESYSGDDQYMIQHFQPGAVILYHSPEFGLDQMATAAQLLAYDNGAQHDSQIPLLTSTDQEGGQVDRLDSIYGPHPSATDIGNTNNPTVSYDNGMLTAQQMLAVGLNTDLAPVVDVESDRGRFTGPITNRNFGTTPDEVIKMGGAWLDGLQENGVIGTLKHFPGLGIARIDPHKGLPTIDRTLSDLNAIDLAPYKALFASADPPGMVMTTDLLLPAVDNYWPAEFSSKIITGILRQQLGFNGVVVTDALYMQGIVPYAINPATGQFDLGTAAVRSLQAGCDMLLGAAGSAQAQQMVDGIKAALTAGTLTQARIDQSVTRILSLKIQRGLLPLTPPAAPPAKAFVGLPADLPTA